MIKKLEKLLDKNRFALIIIALAALIVYSNSFSAPYTLDDFGSIETNHAIRLPWNIPAIWKFYSNRFILYWTISVNYFIHGNTVEGYHIVNVAIHILNGMLVYLILNNLLGLKYFKHHIVGVYKKTISILSALVFVCHPVQVNAVTYIIQRTAALASTFYFLAILFYILFRTTDKIKYFLYTLLATVVAMFTKENTITIPFLLALIELMFFLKDGKTSWKKRLTFLFILFLTVPIIPGTNLYLQGYSQSDPNVSFKASTSMDRMTYFYTQMHVITRYIRLLFVPVNMNFDYSDDFPLSKTIWENNSYLYLILHLVIGLSAVLNIKRNKLYSLGVFWFYIGLAVESSFISIKDVYFEHRLYFPVFGFVLALVGLIFTRRIRKPRLYVIRKPLTVFCILFCILTLIYSAFTLQRNYVFSDGIRLWTDVVRKAPRSDRAHCVLATNYLNYYENNNLKDQEYLLLAEKEFKETIKINNWNNTAHTNLAKVYYLMGEYDSCIYEAQVANNHQPSVYAYHNLGLAYKAQGKINDALDAFKSGYNLDSKLTFIVKSLANAYYDINDYDYAAKYFKEYLKLTDDKEIEEKLESITENQ